MNPNPVATFELFSQDLDTPRVTMAVPSERTFQQRLAGFALVPRSLRVHGPIGIGHITIVFATGSASRYPITSPIIAGEMREFTIRALTKAEVVMWEPAAAITSEGELVFGQTPTSAFLKSAYDRLCDAADGAIARAVCGPELEAQVAKLRDLPLPSLPKLPQPSLAGWFDGPDAKDITLDTAKPEPPPPGLTFDIRFAPGSVKKVDVDKLAAEVAKAPTAITRTTLIAATYSDPDAWMRERSQMADEMQTLRDENTKLLATVGKLTLENETLKRKAKGR